MDGDGMRRFINDFSFDRCKKGNQGFSRILIQLFGLLGNGKSSFINTCICIWEDCEFQNQGKAKGVDGGATTERVPYKLTEKLTLVDNRGCATLEDQESGVIFAQLGNLLPLGKNVNWGEGFGLVERMVIAEKEVKTSDFVYPVFIHSVRKEITDEDKEELKLLFLTVQKLTGVVPIVVLTHKTAGALTKIEGTFRDIGVDRIFSFENYTREDHMKTRGKHEELLKFLCEVIKDVQFRVEQPRNPSEEMKMRRKFMLSYIHEADMKEQRRRVEIKKALEQALQERRYKQQEEEREKEEREQDEEFRRQQEELRRQRERDRARREEEIREQSETQEKKKKKRKNTFFGLFFKNK